MGTKKYQIGNKEVGNEKWEMKCVLILIFHFLFSICFILLISHFPFPIFACESYGVHCRR